MKPRLTFAFLLLCFSLGAQVEFKVKLLPSNNTYQVLFKSNATWNAPLNATSSSQVTLRVPTGGFTVGAVTSLLGTWSFTGVTVAPPEAPGFDYITFGLQNPTTAITYQEGAQVAVFNFANNGSCTGEVELIEHATDPFMPPNSQNVNVGNAVSVIGAGIGQNAYVGNYGAISADCTPSGTCGIEVFDIILTSPSACGVADGSIVIEAVNSANGLALRYSINDGVNFQASNTFSNLAAGDEFEIIVRDLAGICVVDVGTFELDGPLAAIIMSVDIVNPDCGVDNGSITIHAAPQNGGQLEYGIGTPPVYQASNAFNGLAVGTYSFWVMDIVNNCENFVGNYSLTDCQAPNCLLTYDLAHIGNGVYQVSLLSDTTWVFPSNITSSMIVTLKVPTGGFVLGNLTSQLTGINWGIGSTYAAPPEEPGYDYISVNLNSPGTQGIPYTQGGNVPLFTFENTGACTGDSIYLMTENDPFFPPNSQNANVSQQAFVSGAGQDIVVCVGEGVADCTAPPASCLITYELEKTGPNLFQVSMIPDVTWTLPNNITSSLQVTLKVPTGGFDLVNLTSLITSPINVNWSEGSMYISPTEEPGYDYITVTLGSPGTSGITYAQGVKRPLFTFANGGTCQNGNVLLMDNATDPFLPPNSQNANVGQQLFTAGSGADVEACVLNNPANDCNDDPCTQLSVGFTAPDGCEGQAIDFTNTTTSIEAITAWDWDFGNTAASSDENPSNVYSNSGNFEVSLTVTTESGCVATFSDFVTVFPSPGAPAVTDYIDCNGAGVQLSAPAAASVFWSPATGLNDPSIANPFANPAATTVYTVTLTSADGCQALTDVTVNIAEKPVFKDVIASSATDCGLQDGSILVSALGVGDLEYALNLNGPWSTDSLFANLAPGTYTVFVRNDDGTCPIAYNGNPVTVAQLLAPVINNIAIVDPTGCNSDGTITVNASSGQAPLQYSLQGAAVVAPQTSNTFSGLVEGNYTITVTNANGSCEQTENVTLTGGTPPNITSATNAQILCVTGSATATITLSEPIASFTIGGNGSFSNAVINGNTLTFAMSVATTGANNYNVQLTGVGNCVVSENFTVTGVAAPTASFSVSPTLCTGGNINLNYTGTGTGQITWDLDGGTNVFTGQNGVTQVTNFATGGQKQVCVTMSQNGCQVTSCQSINVTAFNPAASFTNTSPGCGASNGAIALNVNAPSYNFQWSGPGISQPTLQNQAGLSGGTYFVTISDNGSGCSTTASTSLPTSTAINATTMTTNATDCSGASANGTIQVQVTGDVGELVYRLFSAGNQIDFNQTTLYQYTFAGVAAGIYTVEVESVSGGCTDETLVAVQSDNSTLTAVSSSTDADCASQNGSISVQVSGGTSGYTYDFFLNNQQLANDIPVVGNNISIGNIAPGNGLVIITDADGCIVPASENIAQLDADLSMISETVTDATCGSNDGSIALSGVPSGAIVSWFLQATNTQIGLGNTSPAVGSGVTCAQVLLPTGCIGSICYTVSSTDGPALSITTVDDASCGGFDGSITFEVSGGAFQYEILGTNISDFGNSNTPITVSGLPAGAYVVEITDLANNNCQAFESVVVDGVLAAGSLVVTAVATPPSACNVEDAEITVTILNSNEEYTLDSDKGDAPNDPFVATATITGLYDGMVTLTLTNEDNGCSIDIPVNLGEIVEPPAPDVAVTSLVCPGGTGSIVSNSATQFSISGPGGQGTTPFTATLPGIYNVETIGGFCEAAITVEVDAPLPWDIDVVASPESCEEEDGQISITVAGANGGYSFDFGNGNSPTETFAGLSAGFYEVTITDALGCTAIVDNIIVDFDCVDCNEIFLVDTFIVQLTGDRTEICLPTEISNMGGFDLFLNNGAYLDELEVCPENTNFYGYGMLLNLGNPPYELEEWTYRGTKVQGFDFNDIAELVAYMNSLDPFGNWSLDVTESSISGGAPGSSYGSLIILHEPSATTLNLQVNTVSVDHPSIFVNDDPFHVLIAENPLVPGCADTLYINLQGDLVDTVYVSVEVGLTELTCLPLAGLSGPAETLVNFCQSATDNAQLISTGDHCIKVKGLRKGGDLFCMEVCDANGICKIIYVIIDVTEDGEFEIFTAFSPNEDGKNDYFRIKGIEQFPNNELRVFNRWGNQVYSKKSYTNLDPWKAIYKNTHLADGTYFYLLDIEMNGEKKTLSGYVQMRR